MEENLVRKQVIIKEVQDFWKKIIWKNYTTPKKK